jgi:hypothetical protein
MSIYCGNNNLYSGLVDGSVNLGTRYKCLQKGIGKGRYLPLDLNYIQDYEPIDNTRIYCGNKIDLPNNYDRFGTLGDCLRKGIGIGKRQIALDNGNLVHTINNKKYNLYLFIFFIILSIIVFTTIYYIKPAFILEKISEKEQINMSKFYLYSSLISICIFIFFYIFLIYFLLPFFGTK